MCAWRIDSQDFRISGNSRDRHDPAAKRFAHHQDVRTDLLVLAGEHSASAGKTRLHLIGNHQDIVSGADFPHLAQISLRRDDDPCFSLDGLYQKAYGAVGDSLL